MRWKYRKLLLNLGNAAQALIGAESAGEVAERAREEGEACLRAAGIDCASVEEDRARRGEVLRIKPVEGRPYGGGSTWQSLQRGTGSIETDYLNGEVSLIGRLHGVPTPVNDLLQRLAYEAALNRQPPGRLSVKEFEARLDRGAP